MEPQELEEIDTTLDEPQMVENDSKIEIGPDGQPVHPFEEPAQTNDDDNQLGSDGLPLEQPKSKFDEPGRVRRFATIMNLLNSLLGAGILSVPASLKNAGIVLSLILLVIIAALSHIATYMTIKLQRRTGADGLDDLALKVTGKIGSLCLSICSMLFCIGAMTGYVVIGADMIMSWLRLANFDVHGTWPRALLVLIYAVIIPAVLTIPKQMKILSYFSMATVFFIGFFFLAMIIKACIDFPKNGMADNIIITNWGMGLFSGISIYALAFALPVVVLPIIQPYNKDIPKRGVVSLWTVLLCLILVAVPAIIGYLLLGDKCADNILNSFDDDDALIIICRIGFFFVVSFSYPCIGQSVIASWAQLVFKKNDQNDLTNTQRIIVLLLTNAIPIIIACFLPNASPALSVAGALGGCVVDFFYPPLMWLLLTKKKYSHYQSILCIIFAIFGVVSGVICTYQAVVDAINSYK